MATVSISATTTTTKVSPDVRFDVSYIKTIPGIIKIAQVIVGLIGFICIQTVPFGTYFSSGAWYKFVSLTAFWVTLILIIFYLFHIIEKLHKIPWLIGEFGFGALWAIFWFIASCVVVASASMDAGYGAAAFFGFVGAILYGYEAFVKYRAWRAGEIAQGERTVTNTTNTSTPTGPSYPTY